MKIFLLVKDTDYLLLIKQILSKIILDKDWQTIEVVTFDNSEDVCLSLENIHNVYFIDTEDNGFILAQKIRKYDFKSTLCFFYEEEEELVESYQYKIEAFDFINKQQSKKQIVHKVEEILLEAKHIYSDFLMMEEKN